MPWGMPGLVSVHGSGQGPVAFEYPRTRIAPKVAEDKPYQNARMNPPSAARVVPDAALMRVMGPLLKDDTEFYKQFVQNESFRRFVTETVLKLTDAEK